MGAKRMCNIWRKKAAKREQQQGVEEERQGARAEAKFIRGPTVQVSGTWPCGRKSIVLQLIQHALGIGSVQRSDCQRSTTDFLVPLPEGEVFHLSELKASKSVPGELCKVFLHLGVPSGCLHLHFPKNQGSD